VVGLTIAIRIHLLRGLDDYGFRIGGRIIKKDIESAVKAPAASGRAAAAAPKKAPRFISREGDYQDIPNTMIRKTIAKRLAESIGPVPTYYLTAEFDAGRAADMRAQLKELGDDYKVSFNDIVIKAVANALSEHPEVNAWWMGEGIRYFNRVHVAMAVAIPVTLLVGIAGGSLNALMISRLNFPLFGNDATDSFDSVTLRADANDGWQWSGAGGEALYARDMWSRMALRDMGQPASDGSRVHLYVNGVYWGLYNPSERPDAAFAADYIGGSKDDWDVLNQDGVTDGNGTAWNTMLSLADAVATAPTEAERTAAYQRIQGNNPDGTDNPAYQDYLDVDSLIDYMLLNIFTGNADWPHRNWYAGRLRADDGVGTEATGFKFFSWDAESALDLLEKLSAQLGH